MKALDIAVIGGGAAGLTCAYLLDEAHRVTCFERQAILGGNIRTLNGNVACDALDADLQLDAGVIEFSPNRFPVFHRLMKQLNIEVTPIEASTGFIRADGRHLRAPGKLAAGPLSQGERLGGSWQLAKLAAEYVRFRRRASAARPGDLYGQSLDEFLEAGPLSEWLRLLMVYAYSTPRSAVAQMPAALTIPTLLQFTDRPRWSSIKGGVYSYIARMVARLSARIITRAAIQEIRRDATGVTVSLAGSEALRFDLVVFATTPEQVLVLLADPSPAEERRFAAWQSRSAETVIHDDCGLYDRRAIKDYSEFDVFEQPAGYNAYLNRLCHVPPEHRRHYHLSYNLTGEVDSAHVLHTQDHAVPGYTVDALASRPEILATNGEHNTFFAGAWLGNGLHEGAITSAAQVASRLGGRRI